MIEYPPDADSGEGSTEEKGFYAFQEAHALKTERDKLTTQN